MALEFGQIEPAQLGQASRFDIPFNEWVGVQFQGGLSSRLGSRLTSLLGEGFDNSPLLSPEDANTQFGIPGVLRFDAAVKAQRAREMRERKDAELKYAAYHESAIHSWLSPKAAIGTLAGLVGGSLHPVDFAINFLPFVGAEVKATELATAGAGVFRQTLARGVITAETIARLPLLSRFPNYSRAIIDATIGNSVLEIPNFYLARRNQEHYDESDLAFNVLGGGLAGGTIAHGIRQLFKLAHFGYERLHGETRDAMSRDDMAGRLSGEERPIHQRAAVDEQAIRDAHSFDESAARADAERIVHDEFRPATAQDLIAQARSTEGLNSLEAGILKRLVAQYDAGERNPTLFQNLAALLNKHYDPQGSLKGLRTELHATIEAISTTEKLLEQASPQVRERVAENIKKLEERRNILAEDIARHQQIAQRDAPVQQMMAARVESVLKERRADAQRMVEGKITEAKAQALEQNIARSKTMTPEQVQKFAAPMEPGEKIAFLEADTAAKTEIATEATKSLEDHVARLEHEAAALEKAGKEDEAKAKSIEAAFVRDELKAQTDAIKQVPDKAIDAIGPCITGI